jgi:hypothetical protein
LSSMYIGSLGITLGPIWLSGSGPMAPGFSCHIAYRIILLSQLRKYLTKNVEFAHLIFLCPSDEWIGWIWSSIFKSVACKSLALVRRLREGW